MINGMEDGEKEAEEVDEQGGRPENVELDESED